MKRTHPPMTQMNADEEKSARVFVEGCREGKVG
jgi:hypothetical protein